MFRWLNTLPQSLLTIRLFTSHGPTVCQPTWFFHKSVFERQGNYIGGVGYPEDQEFFLRHVLEFGGDMSALAQQMPRLRTHSRASPVPMQTNHQIPHAYVVTSKSLYRYVIAVAFFVCLFICLFV